MNEYLESVGTHTTLRGLYVLIVEDEPLIVLMIEDMLRSLGCRIAGVATSPEEALAALERRPAPDAVVLDLNLDGRPSDAVADALVARGVPYLVVTGYGDDAASRAPIVHKPFLDDDLARGLAAAFAATASARAVPLPGVTHVR